MVKAKNNWSVFFQVAGIWALLFGSIGMIIVFASNLDSGTSIFTWGEVGLMALVFIAILEFFFWVYDNKKKPRNQTDIGFTIERKVVNLPETALVFEAVLLFGWLVKNVTWAQWVRFFTGLGTAVVIIAVVAGGIYLWLKLNSLKFRNQKPKRSKNKGSKRRRR